LDVNGSPEYDLTLKQWDMPSGPPIFRLRAWGRRTSGKDCGGWPTAAARDYRSEESTEEYNKARWDHSRGKPLSEVARQTADLVTPHGPRAHDSDDSESTYLGRAIQNVLFGQTPSGGPAGTENGDGFLGGWMSPKASDCKSPGKRRDIHLKHQAEAAGYVTPQAKDFRSGQLKRWTNPVHAVSVNDQVEVFRMPDMTGWKLNPRFSLWLMGYPAEWGYCAVPAMRLCPS
jgi:hypothetical protein